jgi:large subunit ribosomal protein L10
MPSKSILETKKLVVAEVAEKFQNASAAVVVDYRGLTVQEATELRRNLREAGVEFKVLKNSVTRLAAEAAGYGELSEYLTGPNAVAFSNEDVVAPAKILADFAKNHEALELKAGVVEGKFAGLELIQELAALPNREGMLTMLAGAMLAPLKDITIGLNMIVEGEGDFPGGVEATEEVAEEAAVETAAEETTEEATA